MNSYDVKFWDTRKISDTAKGRWRVRWAVAGREHCKSFAARPLADGVPGQPQRRRPRRPAVRPGHRAARPPASRRPAALSPGMSTPAPTPKQMAAPGRQLPPLDRRGADHHHPRP